MGSRCHGRKARPATAGKLSSAEWKTALLRVWFPALTRWANFCHAYGVLYPRYFRPPEGGRYKIKRGHSRRRWPLNFP